ncbi:alanine--tRNA ligase [Massilibacteroides sp.]|uniref:alanine--tRNA ligase n=1 Tax=Massilibacteroides sp. TaxID=2034766 RepID=UPI002610F653|nr:alanine--tRNA ligase [Massilibacteroides sp.]MDD4514821.1 alanine--tRNA ligase [Massilibacteroides sp.]
MLTAKETRESFKAFFASKGHQIVPSAPMVIKGDPTLMFTNAGMNQFKDIILGNVPIKYPRIADSQKCLRVSGKHNDLEEVGHDTYHHTMFEMLGNWSFGDYFKKEAISWAWEYLVDVLKLDPDRLYATVFEGSPKEGLSRDDEAAGYWEQFLPEDHILNGNKKDNFWEMGDTGPCGPCSEIHIDLRSDKERAAMSGAEMVNKDHPQVIEIWNLVFMQYNRKADGSLDPLPAKVIDTGMGFERLCMALQGKTSNYDTDAFQPIIQDIASKSGFAYGRDKQKDIAMRVIADHIRTIAFSITDGQLPSNAKAGYVIRRILRRAVRYGYTFLDRREAFMYKLLPVLIETMGDAYPELISQKTLIEKVIKEEEESFLRTLETGIRLLDKKIAEATAAGINVLNGTDAFTLYDTYGFPLDLTELILRENKMEVDLDAFNAEMQKQKERARNAAAIETGDWMIVKNGDSQFVGYDHFECDVEILRYRKIKQKNKELYQLVLDKTPFYAEMGGQVGDIGWLINGDEKIDIIDTKRENNLPVHLTARLPKDITASFTAKINVEKRVQCECNHTGTHLLHEALREVLGTHVEQKGSFVSPETLRFDFSHYQKVTDEEIREIEKLVGKKIRENYKMEEFRSVPIKQAKEMGAMALFGEKYGDEVRVIKYGNSIELCGGTHIPSTGMIGSLRIVGESSIAAGVRRIEAVTAEKAEEYTFTLQDILSELRQLMNNMPNVVQAVKKSIEENAEMKNKLDLFVKEKTKRLKEELLARAENKNGVLIVRYCGVGNADMGKDIAFQLKGEINEPFAFVGGFIESPKCTLMVMLSDDLVAEGSNASKLVKDASRHIQGGGGGQPHFATAGGKNPDGLTIAINEIIESLNK